MFAVLVFIALVVNVLGSITGKSDRWGSRGLLPIGLFAIIFFVVRVKFH